MKPASHFDRIVSSFRRRKPKPHTPRFRIAKDRLGWRVFDGEKAIAMFMPLAFDIWSFSPFEPDETVNIEPPGKVVDLHTVHNTFINLGTCGWPKHWLDQDPRRPTVRALGIGRLRIHPHQRHCIRRIGSGFRHARLDARDRRDQQRRLSLCDAQAGALRLRHGVV